MNKNETDGAVELINTSICQFSFTWSRALRIARVNNSKKQRTKIEPLHNQSRKPEKPRLFALCAPLHCILATATVVSHPN